MTQRDLGWLRAQARRATLGGLDELAATIARLGFVQADPIRAPARAQDLILRHRVRGYRAGQLERRFPRLGLEEDFLHAYGFMPPATQALLHPRHDAAAEDGRHLPQGLAAEVLDFVRAQGPCHPRMLEAAFGKQRAINGWGGFSQATTRALESLQHFGLLRVSHRQEGIRVYALAASPAAA
ncbi:DNA glycosylase AlkZ-like family protein, partial [Teichococcus deserti]|uniref:DNA glycosylase AlkZ-like family protein n=1 Tax=Teichococcus deserti TaxID=1817963 RepID=UPI001A95A883